MRPETIEQLIKAGMTAQEVVVEGDGAHFTAVVISTAFEGKSRIKRQQLVLDTVSKELLDGTLHALSIKTFTPEEWAALDPSHEEGA